MSAREPDVRALRFSGGHTARVTPVPIPNTVVKPRWADDTARATVWERRSPPGLNSGDRFAIASEKAGLKFQAGLFCFELTFSSSIRKRLFKTVWTWL